MYFGLERMAFKITLAEDIYLIHPTFKKGTTYTWIQSISIVFLLCNLRTSGDELDYLFFCSAFVIVRASFHVVYPLTKQDQKCLHTLSQTANLNSTVLYLCCSVVCKIPCEADAAIFRLFERNVECHKAQVHHTETNSGS